MRQAKTQISLYFSAVYQESSMTLNNSYKINLK